MREGEKLRATEALKIDTQKHVHPPKQQPMIYVCGECNTENEIKIQGSNQMQRMWIQNNVQEKD